jgi:DUF1680 family protein
MINPHFTRRRFLWSASAIAFASPVIGSTRDFRVRATPAPLEAVRLKPSIFADHVEANRRYLRSLQPERLLHNFHRSAGLEPLGESYGGWEAQGIAGHTLGHWMSAVSIIIANSGDPELAGKLDLTVAELARIQTAHGDGYVGGTTVVRDGKTVDGKIVFEEVRRGQIQSQGWDLNGGWVPIYTWHKVQAGLIDAVRLARNEKAMPVLTGMADYLATIVEQLSDAQIQQVLQAEHGGINEAFANTYALTGNPRWLRVAEKLRHKAVLDPLTQHRDILSGLHANTQIPKIIGLARLYELTGAERHAEAATFFHNTVTRRHSYVIGGNSEREHFGTPGRLQDRITEATCEACNSYNMLKLTRHLYSWAPSAELFDFYERVQLNHMLAHHRPDTGMFVYFMPMAAGAKRKFSRPEDDFWCCVGSGMESAAKHADSIYWAGEGTLYINLFIPSSLDWREQGFALDLDSSFPDSSDVRLTIRGAPRGLRSIAIRLPNWAERPSFLIGGKPCPFERRDGYAIIRRRWSRGDEIAVSLPMTLRSEPILGDPSTVAFLSGPLVLAADLGSTAKEFTGPSPALMIGETPLGALQRSGVHSYSAKQLLGGDVTLRPFFPLYDRRTSVYFKTFTKASWEAEGASYIASEKARQQLAERTIDIFHIGEQQPEHDHSFTATKSDAGQFYGKSSRRISQGESMSFRVARTSDPSVLQLTYVWYETDREIEIEVDGKTIAIERRPKQAVDDWVVVDYPLPNTKETSSEVRVTARKGDAAIFGVRVLKNASSAFSE